MSALNDLTGKKFHKLRVLKRAKNNERNQAMWVCECSCGKKKTVLGYYLSHGLVKSCGCLSLFNPKKYKDLKGQKFGRLSVISLSKQRTASGSLKWNCKCDCGSSIRVMANSLLSGNTKSCGCLKKEMTSKENSYQAKRCILKNGVWIPKKSEWYSRAANIMARVKKDKIPCNFKSIVDFATHLKDITPDKCPVFNKKLVSGIGCMHDWSPSVDKIIPSKGYVKGNIQVISLLANRMKADASPKQLKQFATWINKENHYA